MVCKWILQLITVLPVRHTNKNLKIAQICVGNSLHTQCGYKEKNHRKLSLVTICFGCQKYNNIFNEVYAFHLRTILLMPTLAFQTFLVRNKMVLYKTSPIFFLVKQRRRRANN